MGGSRNVYCRGVKENSVQLQGQLASYCFEDGWQQEKWSAKAVVLGPFVHDFELWWRACDVHCHILACSYSHGFNSACA